MNKLEQLENIYKSSPFNISGYTVNILFNRLQYILADYGSVNQVEKITTNNFHLIVPQFQRNIDNWTNKMKQQYVENVLLGAPSNVILYSLDSRLVDCKILDGQHRCMSLLEFMEDKFTVFNDVYYSDIKEHWITHRINRFTMTVHEFKDEAEAIDFYIKINEGITHTPEDIEKAKAYMNKDKCH